MIDERREIGIKKKNTYFGCPKTIRHVLSLHMDVPVELNQFGSDSEEGPYIRDLSNDIVEYP
jgi:hypothetical protein